MGKIVKGVAGLAVITLVAVSVTSFWAVRHYDVSLRFLASKSLEKLGVQNQLLDSMLRPPVRYSDRPLDGIVRTVHPRILLPELASWDGIGVAPVMAERLALHAADGSRLGSYKACGRKHVMSHVLCWLTTGDGNEAKQAVDLLLAARFPVPEPNGRGKDLWEWTLAFDLLSKYPGFSARERDIITAKMRSSLEAQLRLLDDESVSLWHGRSSNAAQAWLLAIALHNEPNGDTSLTRRAQGHFQQGIRALALTEAWPEGYNYWINSRALVMALAASAYVNGLEQSQFKPLVLRALRRVGLWTVYLTRPDNRMEALGDEGPRVDLKDETRRVIDLIAQTTGDSVFATYSSYLAGIHGRESYYRGYRWSFMLFNDPSVRRLPQIAPGSLEGLDSYLPGMDLFGDGSMNLFVSRSGWGADDTLITLRAGHTFTHHGHYDAGHFTVFKGAPLAINSSMYNGFFTPHRLYYGIRTIAKNSILVVRPGDSNQPDRLIRKPVNDGGQRLVLPTGSRVRDLEQWSSHLGAGNHYEGAELQEEHFQPRAFAYIKADLTAAYDSTRYDSQGNNGKVSLVARELLHVVGEDLLLVRDVVVATDPTYEKKWLLHTVRKPQVDKSRIILGNEDGGVLESVADTIRIENGRGRLDVKRILPEDAVLRLVGGEGYQYYVETDGTNASGGPDRNGENFSGGGEKKPWFDNGMWRIEIRPGQARDRDEFLVALSPSLGVDRSQEVIRLDLIAGDAIGLATSGHLVIYTGGRRLGSTSFAVPGDQKKLLIVGVVAGDAYELIVGDRVVHHKVTRSGVLELALSLEAERDSFVTVRQK